MNEAPTVDEAKGFLSKLFDLSFQSFITTSVVRVLFILFIALGVLNAIAALGLAATNGVASLIVGLFLVPLFFLAWVMVMRVWLEIVIVLFRIAEDVNVIARNGGPRL